MSRSGLVHLARRWWWFVHPPPFGPQDEAWARAHCSHAEWELFSALDPRDRIHSVNVARRVDSSLAPEAADREIWVAAALLHDVGKAQALLGWVGRVLATVMGWCGARRWADRWAGQRGYLGALARYQRYEELGAADLGAIGSDPRVVAWALEHHLPADVCTADPVIAAMLRAADT